MTRRNRQVPIGALSKNSAAQPHFVPPRQNFVAPDRLCNATSPGKLEMDKLWRSPQRPNSDHRALPSVGGC